MRPFFPLPKQGSRSPTGALRLVAMLLGGWLVVALGTGCLSPEANGDAPAKQDPSGIEDPDLLAGSSSRTTWPPDLGGDTSIEIDWQAGDSLKFLFKFPDAATDQGGFKVTGKLTLFRNGGIPALDSAASIELDIADKDSIAIPAASVTALFKPNQDSLQFNVLIETEHWGSSFMMGFVYRRQEARFIEPASSLFPPTSNFLVMRENYYKGTWVATDSFPSPIGQGKTNLSFYIPGSPFHWKALPDTLRFGPLPAGNYPLRLLRVTEPDDGLPGSVVEVFEVLEQGSKHTANFQAGERILSVRTEKAVTVRGPSLP